MPPKSNSKRSRTTRARKEKSTFMTKLGVLCVHGMGNQTPAYADEMVADLKKRVGCAGLDPETVAFKSVFWGDLLDDRQNNVMSRMAEQGQLAWRCLRREIVVSGLGDAAAYLGPGTDESAYYGAIHSRMETTLGELQEMLGGKDGAPLVIVAHSLGCAITSNYLWDAQRETPWARGITPFTRGETLAGLFTLGCNLPIFTFTKRSEDVVPIAFPGARAAKAFRDQAAFRRHAGWLNFYDPEDLLGYPLRPINSTYAKVVAEDAAVNTGPIWRAHTSYWSDPVVNAEIARRVIGLVRAL
jgi:hypothetical protein